METNTRFTSHLNMQISTIAKSVILTGLVNLVLITLPNQFIITTILPVVSCETSVEQYTRCNHTYTCTQDELCEEHKCVNVCKLTKKFVVTNAICTAFHHVPEWKCPDGYNGKPFTSCTKTCDKEEDCATMDVCMHGQCTPGCETIACERHQNCFTMNNYAHCY